MFYIKTSEPHNCEEGLEVWKQQKQKTLTCKYCLDVDLMFDDEHMTPGGKHVPLEAAATGEIHQCSKRRYNPNTKIATTIF
jgi:hypothetical protein